MYCQNVNETWGASHNLLSTSQALFASSTIRFLSPNRFDTRFALFGWMEVRERNRLCDVEHPGGLSWQAAFLPRL
jgi:hypothetical protein